jgi:hypothetical protein
MVDRNFIFIFRRHARPRGDRFLAVNAIQLFDHFRLAEVTKVSLKPNGEQPTAAYAIWRAV